MIYFTFIRIPKNAGTSINDAIVKLPTVVNVVASCEHIVKGIDSVSFAVSRNPYTRCLSSWKYCDSTKDRRLLDCLANPPQRSNVRRIDHDYQHFTMKQSDFIFQGGFNPTHILRYEHLENDLRNMFSLYNFSISPLQKLNVGSYDYTLSDEEREAIYEFYKEDFDNLGYEK